LQALPLGVSETAGFTAGRLQKRSHPNAILNGIWGINPIVGIKKSGNLMVEGIHLVSTRNYGRFFPVKR